MANKLESGSVFGTTGARDGVMSLAFSITSGSVTLQKLVGNDESGTWVDVTDGSFSTSGETSFYAPRGQKFRVQYTDATVYVAG